MACCGSGLKNVGVGTMTRLSRSIVYVVVPRDDIDMVVLPDTPTYETEAAAMAEAPSGYVARAVVIG